MSISSRRMLAGLVGVSWWLSLATSVEAADPLSLKQCGLLHDYVAANAITSGSIGVGSRTFQIAIGASVPTPPVGTAACISGPTLASQTFTTFTVEALPREACGRIGSVAPPTAAAAGLLALGSSPELVVKITAGTDLPAGLEGSARCVELALDGAGDLSYVSSRSSLPSTSTAAARVADGMIGTTVVVVGVVAGALALCAAVMTRRAGLRRAGRHRR